MAHTPIRYGGAASTMSPVEGGGHETPTVGPYAIALAVLFVGLVALGVPASTLLVAALVLTCDHAQRPATHYRPPLVPAEIR